jgi:glycosyltransferase involved in cell wall biosynthesis
VRAVALDERLGDLDAGRSSGDVAYRSVRVLVRLHGEPLGFPQLELSRGALGREALALALWEAVGDRVRDHAKRHGCLADVAIGPDAFLQGLGAMERCAPARGEQAPSPPATVVVPTAGRAELLRGCLACLASLDYPAFDVVVVDNDPRDDGSRRTVEAAAREGLPVRYLAETRQGSSVARNTGLASARGEVVAFTDDDVRVDRDWLRWLVSPFADRRVGAVTGLVLPAEVETPAQLWFERYGGFAKGFQRRDFDRAADSAGDVPLFPYWGGAFGSGNSMAFRTGLLRDLGGFDPALGAGSPARAGADIEALSRVLLRGARLVYEPRAVCWHLHRRDVEALRRQLFAYGAGFTAILSKWALRDPAHLLPALARAGSRAVRGSGNGSRRMRDRPGLPPELGRLELLGYLVGPALYARGALAARRARHGRRARRGGEAAARNAP